MNTIAIWNLYAIDVERFILSIVQDECVSKYLLQGVFLMLHVNKHRLKESDKVKSWLFSIARNIVVDYYRKKRVLQVVDQMEVTEEPLINQVHTEVECLKGIINVLPPKYKVAVQMADLEGKKQQEIADSLGISLPAVKSRILRARKMIVEGFMDCCDFKLNSQGKLVGEVKERELCKVCQ